MIPRSFGSPWSSLDKSRLPSQGFLETGGINSLAATSSALQLHQQYRSSAAAGLSSLSTLVSSLDASRLAAAAATTTTSTATSKGLPLNLLVDAAIGKVALGRGSASASSPNYIGLSSPLGLKRGPTEDTCSSNSTLISQFKSGGSASFPHKKKARMMETETALRDNPILMQRLSAMSGGFPMPCKWGAFLNGGKAAETATTSNGTGTNSSTTITEEAVKISKELDIPPTSIGAFPMPRAKEDDRLRLLTEKPVLTSFQYVWEQSNGDVELQKEVLARKLQRGTFLIAGKPNKMVLNATA